MLLCLAQLRPDIGIGPCTCAPVIGPRTRKRDHVWLPVAFLSLCKNAAIGLLFSKLPHVAREEVDEDEIKAQHCIKRG